MLKQGYKRLLSQYTSLKIGGPALCWLEPEGFDDILECISIAETKARPLVIIGRGTNILVQDEGLDAVVMNLRKGFDCIEREENVIVKIGSGLSIARLVRECAEWGLGGCEFLAGIPASFGGALFMNAGVRETDNAEIKREMKDIVVDVDVIDLKDKKRKNLKRDEIDFTYRSSGLAGKCILGARIKLETEKREIINNRIDSFMKKREWIRRLRFPSAGSIFKNPDNNNSAGRLIDLCGLKGRRIGGAEISMVHANVIVNTGGATSKDVLDLIDLARSSVKKEFGIDLELELKVM